KAERIKIEDAVRKLEKEIFRLEEKQEEINAMLSDPQSYGDSEKAKELNEKASSLARQLKERNYEWEIETEKLLELDV
ncbi:MAG TPA: ABC transporter ATP-binding protein, partial [Opitutae bacterium]|nr:ABC transporter ATP-binding protein [Opitutae bacterium]